MVASCHSQIESNWGHHDDVILKEIACQNRYDWKKVTRKFEKSFGKKVTPLFLKNRYHAIRDNSGPLNEEDDKNLVRAIEQYGLNWENLYEVCPDKNKIQVRNRYYSKLKNKSYYKSVLDKIRTEEGCRSE